MNWSLIGSFVAALVAVTLGQLGRLSGLLLNESTLVSPALDEAFVSNSWELASLVVMLSVFIGVWRTRGKSWRHTCLGVAFGLFAFTALLPNWAFSHFSWSFVLTVVLSVLGILHFPGWNQTKNYLSERSDWLELRRSQYIWAKFSRARKIAITTLGCFLILVWQSTFFFIPPAEEPAYKQCAAVGVVPKLDKFVDVLYHSNYFPLVQITLVAQDGKPQPPQWVTELGFATRFGENAKPYLFLPNCYVSGSADNPSCRLSNFILFSLSLLALFVNGCRHGFPTLSGILVLLLGSNPFQLQAVHSSNVFSWTISMAILALALHLGYLLKPGPMRASALVGAIGCGFLLATVRHVRSEPAVIAVSIFFTLLLCSRLALRNGAALIGLLLLSLSLTQAGWNVFFHSKISQAERLCREWGGTPYSGPREKYHILWHTLWIGLGDYGQDRGYAWDDRAAYHCMQPVLQQKYQLAAEFDSSGYYLKSNWDNHPAYPRLMTDYPEYELVARSKVVEDIRQNPLWYGTIILRRLNRVMNETTPIRITLAGYSLSLPFHGLLCLPLLLVLALVRSRLALLILFVAPTSLTSVLVYSGRGTCLSSIFHAIGAGLLLTYLLEILLPKVDNAGADST